MNVFRPKDNNTQEQGHTEETRSTWYNKVSSEISPYQYSLSKKDLKKYKLDLLLRVAGKVDGFSATCQECQAFQKEITQLAQEASNLIQLPDKDKLKSHFRTIANIVKHLQKTHKLISQGQYLGIGLTIGTGVGMALGNVMGSTTLGIAIGIVLGLAVGAYLDRKAKAEGRII